jgi:hypothetical protein
MFTEWQWYQVCLQEQIRAPSTVGVEGYLDGPGGSESSTSYGQGVAMVAYSNIHSPTAGIYDATGSHYLTEDTYQCDLVFFGWGGNPPLWNCYYLWSGTYYMGATSAQATVGFPDCVAPNYPSQYNQVAVDNLYFLPHAAWEIAATIRCRSINNFVVEDWNDSFGYYYPSGVKSHDPCLSTTYFNSSGSLAGIHTHPLFLSVAEYRRERGCRDSTYNNEPPPVEADLIVWNQTINAGFSPDDINNNVCRNSPLYMRSPLPASTIIKKLQGSSTCNAQDSVVFP